MIKKDKEQSERFIEKAQEVSADESGEAFEQAFKRIVPPVQKSRKKTAPLKQSAKDRGASNP